MIFLICKRSKAHPRQEAAAVFRRPARLARQIHPHHRTRPHPRRRNPDPEAHPQRPRQPGLRPDTVGDRSDVGNCPTPDADPAACNHDSHKTPLRDRRLWRTAMRSSFAAANPLPSRRWRFSTRRACHQAHRGPVAQPGRTLTGLASGDGVQVLGTRAYWTELNGRGSAAQGTEPQDRGEQRYPGSSEPEYSPDGPFARFLRALARLTGFKGIA